MNLRIPLRRVESIPVEVKYNRVTGVRLAGKMVDGRLIAILVGILEFFRAVHKLKSCIARRCTPKY